MRSGSVRSMRNEKDSVSMIIVGSMRRTISFPALRRRETKIGEGWFGKEFYEECGFYENSILYVATKEHIL